MKPHIAAAVEMAGTSPPSQQALAVGHMLIGPLCSCGCLLRARTCMAGHMCARLRLASALPTRNYCVSWGVPVLEKCSDVLDVCKPRVKTLLHGADKRQIMQFQQLLEYGFHLQSSARRKLSDMTYCGRTEQDNPHSLSERALL